MVTLRGFGAALSCAALVLAARAAEAQTVNAGWALDRYEPTPAGDAFFMADHPWYSSTRAFAAGLTLDNAFNPLVFRETVDGASVTTAAVSGMLVGHVSAAASFLDRVSVALSLPVVLSQSGAAVTNGDVTLGPGGAGVGDLRLTARVRLFGHADVDGLSLHLGAHLWAPVGARDNNTGDEGVRVEPRLILAGRGGPVRWSTTVGLQVRPSRSVSNLGIGQELRVSAALGVVLANERLTVGPEAYVVSLVGDAPNGGGFFGDQQWGGEAMLGAHYLFGDAVLAGLGGGVGLEHGYGIPAGRLLVSLAYAPAPRAASGSRPLDTDGDGVLDPDDRCPTTPQGARPDAERPGCPLGDSDGDGAYDDVDRCPDAPQGAHPDPARRGCPLPDRDHDGVHDGDDACPDEPQGAAADPARAGCPLNDRDHDAVNDPDDACPDEPQMPFPDPSRRGCPLPDADHDRVPEPPDACPGVAGVPSSDPRRNGCPNARVQMSGSEIRILEQVFFDADRDTIKRRSFRVLEAVADVLAGATFVRRVSIEGHTDDRASPEHNLDLSQRRAGAVLRWLAEHGVAADRLEAHGFGQQRPLVPNDSGANRARNRRVEFRIVDPASGPAAVPVSAAVVDAPAAAPVAAPEETGRHGHHGRHGGGHHGGGHHRRR